MSVRQREVVQEVSRREVVNASSNTLCKIVVSEHYLRLLQRKVMSSESVELSLTNVVGKGGFATVFAHGSPVRAIKVFRRMDDAYDGALAHVFASEVEALARAAANEQLSQYCPVFSGPVVVTRVLDQSGKDVSGLYHLTLAYGMELIPRLGEERKFGSFHASGDWKQFEQVAALFAGAGIDHVGDGTVLNWQSGSPKIIDFAMHDEFADWVPD